MEKQFEEKIKSQRAVTFTTLIITIIIILILAGITISSITDESGIFMRAKIARNNTLMDQQEENELESFYEVEIRKAKGID